MFRIMQLQVENGNWVKNMGIKLKYPCFFEDFGFAKIQSIVTPMAKELDVTTASEYTVEELQDGFKIIKINPVQTEEEEEILIIIPQSTHISSKCKKIAGRYVAEEGIYLMKPNEKIKVDMSGLTAEFAALKFEKKMYLEKLY